MARLLDVNLKIRSFKMREDPPPVPPDIISSCGTCLKEKIGCNCFMMYRSRERERKIKREIVAIYLTHKFGMYGEV
jgi:hypothetical protein